MTKIFDQTVRSKWYVTFVMLIWIFEPEIRRIVDWRSSFHALSILSILPIATLVPGIFIARNEWSRSGKSFRRIVTLWLLGFGYALLLAAITHPPVAALYSFTTFCIPIAFGVLLGAPSSSVEESFDRFADVSLIAVAISALYGLYQYAAPPPWDTYWAQQANIENSQGATVAFGFRVFGTLNSTGPFAEALMIALLLNLPRVSLRRWYVPAAFIPIVIALALTSVRAMWIGLVIGIATYVILSANRVKVVSSLAIVAVLIFGAATILAGTVKESTLSISALSDRIATLGALNNDQSAQARQGESAAALVQGFAEPLGEGLGALGTAAKLGAGGSTVVLDSGYLSRFLEMGVVGFALFMGAVILALFAAFRAYARARRDGNRRMVDIFATAIGFQIIFLYLEFIADTHVALGGLLFWATAYVVSRWDADHEPAVLPNLGQAALRFSAPNR